MILIEFENILIERMEYFIANNKCINTDFAISFKIKPSGLDEVTHTETCSLCYDNTGVHVLWFSDWYQDYDMSCCYFTINGIYSIDRMVEFYNKVLEPYQKEGFHYGP